jgi:hypothetical protein
MIAFKFLDVSEGPTNAESCAETHKFITFELQGDQISII